MVFVMEVEVFVFLVVGQTAGFTRGRLGAVVGVYKKRSERVGIVSTYSYLRM